MAASYNGCTPPLFNKKGIKIDAKEYCDTMEYYYHPHISVLYPDGKYIFQYNGAPSHTADASIKKANKLFGNGSILQNPPNSPDLSLLDYCVWGAMKVTIKNMNPKTAKELRTCVVRASSMLDKAALQKAVDQYLHRLETCVKNGGHRFEHAL